MEDSLAKILDDLADQLQLRKELGDRTIEVDDAVWKEWTMPPASPSLPAAPASSPVADSLPKAHPSSPAAGATPKPTKGEAERTLAMQALTEEIKMCQSCRFSENRSHIVPGEGNVSSPDILFLSEAPGVEDDRQGRPIQGEAGAFLDKMIQAMGYRRDQIYLAPICKCLPPGRRLPTEEEAKCCVSFVKRQIEILRPKVIILLGPGYAARALFANEGVALQLGRWTRYGNIPVMCTYHPAHVLRFEKMGSAHAPALYQIKKEVWEALKQVMAYLKKTK